MAFLRTFRVRIRASRRTRINQQVVPKHFVLTAEAYQSPCSVSIHLFAVSAGGPQSSPGTVQRLLIELLRESARKASAPGHLRNGCGRDGQREQKEINVPSTLFIIRSSLWQYGCLPDHVCSNMRAQERRQNSILSPLEMHQPHFSCSSVARCVAYGSRR